MVVSPHPITVTVNNQAGSVLEGALVYVRNVTKKTTSTNKTTNASGVAVIDLANLPVAAGQTNQYDTGDEILIIAYYSNFHDASKYTVTGVSKAQTLNMNPVRHEVGVTTEKIVSIILANTSGTVAFAKIYNVKDGRLLLHMECPANDSRPAYIGGLSCAGGVCIERESADLVVTAHLK